MQKHQNLDSLFKNQAQLVLVILMTLQILQLPPVIMNSREIKDLLHLLTFFTTSTVRTELPHNLDVGDQIIIRKVTDTSNTSGEDLIVDITEHLLLLLFQ
jgi:hypothetical protein